MKLWVDDIRKPPDGTWSVARTVSMALRYMHLWEPHVVSLDHDISHYEDLDESNVDQRVQACEETFMAVAYYIADRQWKRKPRILIHTSNFTAGKKMFLMLKEAGFEVDENYT